MLLWVLEINVYWCIGVDGYDVIDFVFGVDFVFCVCIVDVSGDLVVFDGVIFNLICGGMLVLVGFYGNWVDFVFLFVFMCEILVFLFLEFRVEDM